MCLSNADIYTQKFGLQRADYYTGVTNAEKQYNNFDVAVYYPTNWRGTYTPERGKTPEFTRYGATTAVSPEYFQRNYLGIFPLGQQPLVDEAKPYNLPRFS